MRGSYSGKYTRAPLSLHGFESRTSLQFNRFYHPDDEDLSSGTPGRSSNAKARDPYSRDWRSSRHRSSNVAGRPL